MFSKLLPASSILAHYVPYIADVISKNYANKFLAYPSTDTKELCINLSSSRGNSIDDVYVHFKQLANKYPKIIQHSKIEIIQEKSNLYFDKYSIIRLTISDGIRSNSQEINLDSEIHSGHDYFVNDEKNPAILKFKQDEQGKLLKSDVQLISVQPKHQFGATCKLVAIAQSAEIYEKDKTPPIYKNASGRYVYTDNGTQKEYIEKNTHQESIRSLAKQHIGSMQGEILDYRDMVKLLNNIGYNADVSIPQDIDAYRKQIKNNLKNNKASIVFFSVSTRAREHSDVFTGQVDEMFEHVATVTGYNASSDKVRLTHWGNHYWQPVADVFASSNNLVETRSEEYYKINHKNPQDGAWKYKQMSQDEIDAVKHLSKEQLAEQGIKKTKAPADNTGFKGKLLTVYPKKTLYLTYFSIIASNILNLNSYKKLILSKA